LEIRNINYYHPKLGQILRFRIGVEANISTGTLLNLISVDVNCFGGLCTITRALVSPLQLLILGYTLWKEIGMQAATGLGILFIVFPFQGT
jgi:hypothetical protein